MSGPSYIRSGHVLVEWAEGDCTLTQCSNGRSFAVSPAVVAALSHLGEPRTPGQLAAELPQTSATEAQELLSALQARDLVHESGDGPAEDCLWTLAEHATQVQASGGGVRRSHPSRYPPPARLQVTALRRVPLGPVPERAGGVASVLSRRRSVRTFTGEQIALPQLSALLGWSARFVSFLGEPRWQATHRPYPSAGGRHPLEIFILARDVAGLDPGTYHYDAFTHELAHIQPWDARNDAIVQRLASGVISPRPTILFYLVALPERVLWKYRALALLNIYRDTGCLLQTLYLVATELELGCCALAKVDSPPLLPDFAAQMSGAIHVGSLAVGHPADEEQQPDDN